MVVVQFVEVVLVEDVALDPLVLLVDVVLHLQEEEDVVEDVEVIER